MSFDNSLSLFSIILPSNKILKVSFNDSDSFGDILNSIDFNYLFDKNEYQFYIEDNNSTSFWLLNNKNILDYNISTDCKIYIKNRYRKNIIIQINNKQHKFIIDIRNTILDIIKNICEQLFINNYNEYSLKIHNINENKYLKLDKCLKDYNINDSCILILEQSIYNLYSFFNINKSNINQVNTLYIKCKELILNDSFYITKHQAIIFASIQLQIEQDSYNPDIHKCNSLELLDILPKQHQRKRKISQKIINEYKKLKNCNKYQCKVQYIQACETYDTFGSKSFHVIYHINDKQIPSIICLNCFYLCILDNNSLEVLERIYLRDIRRWVPNNNRFIIDLYKDYYTFESNQAENISDYLSTLFDIILLEERKQKELELQISIQDGINIEEEEEEV